MTESGQDNPPKRVVFRGKWGRLARLPLQRFAHRLVGELTKGSEFTCMVTGDDDLTDLNSRYRGKRESTDVLSFPAVDSGGQYLGDVVICAPRARQQARDFGHSWNDEVCVLMLHGVLHLLGMDHETDNGRMRRAEARWRSRFGLPTGLIARTK